MRPCRVMPGWRRRTSGGRHARRGLTLIELLLALLLAALLAALTGRIAAGALASRRYAEEAIARVERRAVLFEAVGDDIALLLADVPGRRQPVVLFGMPQPVLELTTLAAGQEESNALHTARRPSLVRYRSMAAADRPDDRVVVREVLDLTDPAAVPIRETLAKNVESFEVTVLQNKAWSTATAESKSAKDRASAVRVGIRWKGDHETTVRTFPCSAK